MYKLKIFFIAFISAFISFFTTLEVEIQALVIFMVIDYSSGIFLALFFKNSNKTETGAYSSKAGFIGLSKKILVLLLLLVLFYVDKVIGTNVFLTLGAVGFSINEIASILENAGLMGVKIPKAFEDALDILKNREEK